MEHTTICHLLRWKVFWESHDKKDYLCVPELESLDKTI